MQYTTAGILTELVKEKEINSYVSKELLAETNTWIDLFKSYPEIGFDLNGNPEMFLTFLSNNNSTIRKTVNDYFTPAAPAATEEEAGVLEGFIEITEDPERTPVIQKKPLTITISLDDLYNMYSHVQEIVNGHTDHINRLQEKLDASNNIPTPEPLYLEPAPLPAPAIQFSPAPVIEAELPNTPPIFSYDYPQENHKSANTELHEEPELEELESHEFDDFSDTPESSNTDLVVKPKLSTGKKIVIVLFMLIALAVLIATLFMPTKKVSKNELEQMQPPSSLNAPIAASIMKNISTAKPIIPVQPAPAAKPEPTKAAPVVLEPASQPKPELKPVVKSKLTAESKSSTNYTENMTKYIKADHDNTMSLGKGEKVTDIEGQDTENWTFNYIPKTHTIAFNAKTNKLKNTIIIKTNKKTYTINLISSNKGFTRINLAD